MEYFLQRVRSRVEETLGDMDDFAAAESAALFRSSKMLRSILLCAFAGNETSEAVELASGLEMLHTATIIHDDIIDNSRKRRGDKPLYLKSDITSALLIGDYIFTKGYNLISAVNCALCGYAAGSMSDVLRGEILQRNLRYDFGITEEKSREIIEKKTGELFGLAALMGTWLRSGGRADMQAYQTGKRLGAAYQMLDDCGDYLFSSETKDRMADIRQGVITLPLLRWLALSSRQRTDRAEADIRGGNLPPDIVEEIAGKGCFESVYEEAASIIREESCEVARNWFYAFEGWSMCTGFMERIVYELKKEDMRVRGRVCGNRGIGDNSIRPKAAERRV